MLSWLYGPTALLSDTASNFSRAFLIFARNDGTRLWAPRSDCLRPTERLDFEIYRSPHVP